MTRKLTCQNGHSDRFETGLSTATMIGWSPIIDAEGNQLNQDPNTYTTTYRCLTCNAEFQVNRRMGEYWTTPKEAKYE